MAWDMCNQDSVWSDIEVSWGWARHCSRDRSFPPDAIIPVRGEGLGQGEEAGKYPEQKLLEGNLNLILTPISLLF